MNNIYKKCAARIRECTAPQKIKLTVSAAETILKNYFPDSGRSCLRRLSDSRTNAGLAEMGGVLLSIIIPSYNNAAYVTKAIDSCLVQKTKYSFEVVVVNDGSTDNTANVLEKYKGDSRVKIFMQENRGFSGARNAGIEHSTGKWLMFLDSDDTLTENAVDSLLRIATEKDADIVEGNYIEVYPNGEKKVATKLHTGSTVEVNKDEVLSTLRGQPWGKVIRSHLFWIVYFPEGYWFEDSVMHMVIYPMAETCYTTDEVVYHYLINPNGITSQSRGKKKCIDSFYITRRLLEDRCKLEIELTAVDYKFFLGQVRMNWHRTRLLPEKVRRAIFVESCELNREYFDNFRSKEFDGRHGLIKNALDCGYYKDYISAMTLET